MVNEKRCLPRRSTLMRVRQRGDCLDLALEPLFQIRVGGDVLGEHLNGDGAVQAGVPGLVHLAHPLSANGREDFVRAKVRP